ncbi:MAG: pyridoxal-dependent decarboxylase [Bacteroidales bacterium]|nr:pyridoxal-dependent decarboxylase [Bacteroidales bacterium]
MNKTISEVFNTEQFKNVGHKLVDLLSDYLDKAKAGEEMPVLNWKDPDQQVEFWKSYKFEGDDITSFFADILNNSIHLHHPKYMGHQVAPPAPVSALADFLGAVLNNGMVGYEMGSVTTAMEKLAVMVSSEAHYCIDRAARIMGLGADGILQIETNADFEMNVDLLEEAWQEANDNGLNVFAIIGSSCTTASGSYDDLEAIAAFAEKKNIWFHVDGAHGSAVIFSEKYIHLVNGLNRADSVVIDCHKMLMMPALITALLYKKSDHSYHTFQQDAHYLWQQQEDPEWYNYGKRTFECTKLMMSLKFFTLMKVHGVEVLGENVTALYDLAHTFAKLIHQREQFELAMEPQSNIVCFRLIDDDLTKQELNDLNAHVRKEILHDGEFYIVQTTLKGTTYLRTTLMNLFTTSDHLTALLDKIEMMRY